jgi:uncharacterized protein
MRHDTTTLEDATMRLMLVKSVMHRSNNTTAVLKLETSTADLCLELALPAEEANRLVRLLGAIGCRCTPIYESLLALAAQLGATLTRIVLDAEQEGINASTVFARSGSEIAVQCHAADAIALALRTQAPIYATNSALAQAWPIPPYEPQRARGELARWIEAVRPSDFAAPPRSDP